MQKFRTRSPLESAPVSGPLPLSYKRRAIVGSLSVMSLHLGTFTQKWLSRSITEAQLGDTDEDLCDLIKRCWAQQSQQRPSFHEIVDELEPKLAYTTGAE